MTNINQNYSNALRLGGAEIYHTILQEYAFFVFKIEVCILYV